MSKVAFQVNSKPTNEVPGQTDVLSLHYTDGEITNTVTVGSLTKTRKVPGVTATVTLADGTTQDLGNFGSRSQAGHAVQAAYYAEDRAAHKAEVAAAAAEKAQGVADRKAARAAAKEAKAAAKAAAAESTETAEIDPEQAKKDARNAKRREARAAAKAAAEAA